MNPTETIDKWLEEIERATEGPWEMHPHETHEGCENDEHHYYIHKSDGWLCTLFGDEKENAQFIAASRTRLPAALKALKVAIESLQYVNRYFKNPMPGFACMECDMGGAGYSTKGDGWHDDKPPHTCTHVEVDKALKEITRELGGEGKNE